MPGAGMNGAVATVTCSYTGGDQTFTVPSGVTQVSIDALGAQGGPSQDNTAGGKGGEATATIMVTPGETLEVEVGGQPAAGNPASGGFNGGGPGGTASNGSPNVGGGGGGASDVRQGGTALADRVIIGGGGGGAGNGTDFSAATPCSGGTGGGTTGGDGASCQSTEGGGGTQSRGGTHGTAGLSQGADGVPGTGGAGGDMTFAHTLPNKGGGGGGGGLFGGGGGAGADEASGGGGGGSGFTPSGMGMTNGVQSGNGKVIITYTVPATPCSAPTVTPPRTSPP